MKTLSIGFTLLCSALVALSAGVRIYWGSAPVDEKVSGYRVYELNGTNKTVVAFSTTTFADVTNVTAGAHTYAVASTNFWEESDLSTPVSTPSLPSKPTGVTILFVK